MISFFVLSKCTAINDVTAMGGGGKGICDDSTKALVIKGVKR